MIEGMRVFGVGGSQLIECITLFVRKASRSLEFIASPTFIFETLKRLATAHLGDWWLQSHVWLVQLFGCFVGVGLEERPNTDD